MMSMANLYSNGQILNTSELLLFEKDGNEQNRGHVWSIPEALMVAN